VSIDLGLNYTYLRTVYEYEFGDEETLTNSGVNLAFGLSIFLTRAENGE
jgi:hypothetical protein